MSTRLITPPGADPVTLAEAKAHLRVDSTDDDALITTLISAATQNIAGVKDGWLNRSLVTQTCELVLDKFPTSEIQIPLPPLISITSVKYVDTDGNEQTIASADYRVDTASEPGWIVPAIGIAWPSPMQTINALTIRFVCGYGAASDVPAPIKAAILLLVGDLYAFRETGQVGSGSTKIAMTATVEALLMPYRRHFTF